LSMYLRYKKNRGVNRKSLDIVRDVLLAASVRARKTRIMYQANLSYTQVEKYLKGLLENDLLCRDGDACYVATGKGLEFLKLYDEYLERCSLIKEEMARSDKDRVFLERMFAGGKPNWVR